MRKLIFLLLCTVSCYGQFPSPTLGTIKTKTSPTVTSVNHLATVEADGTIAKIDPVSLPFQNKRLVQNPIYYKGKEIHWFGDSYTSGSGAFPTSNRFTTLVSSALGAIEINHGVAGATMQKRAPINYMASPNMVDNVVNIPTKTASKAMLVFSFGLNDMGQTAPDYNVTNYKTDYLYVINYAINIKGWEASQILIVPAYYIGSAGYAAYATITGNAAPTEARHLAFTQAAKEVASEKGTMYFDIYQDQNKNDTSLIGVDNIHPTNAGYAYIANDVLQYLGQDKLSITTDTNYSTSNGFVSKINGNKLDNSFIYQNASGIGIATKTNDSSLHVNSLTTSSAINITNSVTTDGNGNGVKLVVDSAKDFIINNRESANVNIATVGVTRASFSKSGRTDFFIPNTNTFDPSGQTVGSISINNAGTSNTPIISGKSITGSGLSLHAITSNANALTDMLFGVREDDGTDYSTLTYTAFGFYRFTTPLLTILRNGNSTFAGSITATSYSGTATLTGNPTAPTAPAGTNNLIIANTNFVTGAIATAKPYKVYTAILNQTGISDPVATVLENTTGATVVWTRASVGQYLGTFSSGVLTLNKTIISPVQALPPYTNHADTYRPDLSTVRIITTSIAANTDGLLNSSYSYVEIRVYP